MSNKENEEYNQDPVDLTRDTTFQEILETQSLSKQIDRLAYSLFGNFFKKHEVHFQYVEDNLTGAQIAEDVDLYLSRTLFYSMFVGIFGLLAFGLLILLLHMLGITTTIDTGLRYPAPLAKFLWIIRPFMFALVGGSIGFGIFTGIAFLLGSYYPVYISGTRKRRIDHTLPHAVTFMYALSKGGMSTNEIMERLAAADGAYGASATEFKQIVKEMEFFSLGMAEALNRASQRTPSEKFEDFCDDLQGIIQSGANTTDFYEDKSQEFREEAEQDQKSFLETLELLGEVYVTLFVAGPLFLVVIIVILALIGGGGPMQLYFIVYGIIPMMNIVYYVFLSTISTDEGYLDNTLDKEDRTHLSIEELEAKNEELEDDRIDRIIEVRKDKEQKEFFHHPLQMMSENPALSLYVSSPAALLALIVPMLLGITNPLWSYFIERPIVNTTFIFTIPFIILILPYTILYELKSRRNNKLMARFPDALKRLASANSIGMTLNESLEAVAANTSGKMGSEFEQIRNDIMWKHNVSHALINFANRMKVQIIARTIKLLTEAADSTGDVENVLQVAAKDVNVQYRLQKKQAQNMMIYTIIIVIAFIVYLVVIVTIDTMFLERLSGEKFKGPTAGSGSDSSSGSSAGPSPAGGMGGGMSVSLKSIPTQEFKLLFFHSTIVQSIGNGILAGQFGSNDPKKGLKFTIALLSLSTAVFLITPLFL